MFLDEMELFDKRNGMDSKFVRPFGRVVLAASKPRTPRRATSLSPGRRYRYPELMRRNPDLNMRGGRYPDLSLSA